MAEEEETSLSQIEESIRQGREVNENLLKKQSAMEGRLTRIEESLQECKETMQKTEGKFSRIEESLQECKETIQKMEGAITEINQVGAIIEMPHFDGTDVENWVSKISDYFDFYGTPMKKRIRIASFYMKGPAYSWYKMAVKNQDFSTEEAWDEFLQATLLRFGTARYEDPKMALKELRQVGTVAEYQSKFEVQTTKVNGIFDSWLISFFVAGLQEHLKCAVQLGHPKSYLEAVSLAMIHEQKHLKLQSFNGP